MCYCNSCVSSVQFRWRWLSSLKNGRLSVCDATGVTALVLEQGGGGGSSLWSNQLLIQVYKDLWLKQYCEQSIYHIQSSFRLRQLIFQKKTRHVWVGCSIWITEPLLLGPCTLQPLPLREGGHCDVHLKRADLRDTGNSGSSSIFVVTKPNILRFQNGLLLADSQTFRIDEDGYYTVYGAHNTRFGANPCPKSVKWYLKPLQTDWVEYLLQTFTSLAITPGSTRGLAES